MKSGNDTSLFQLSVGSRMMAERSLVMKRMMRETGAGRNRRGDRVTNGSGGGGAEVSEPRAEYAKRLAQHEAELAVFEGRHRRFGDAKLAVIATGFLAAWFVVARQAMDADWLWIVVALYAALAVAHELTLRKRRAAESAVKLYRRGIARIEDKWAGSGATGEE